MLTLIRLRLTEENAVCDEVMLHAWSLLWNVTGLLVDTAQSYCTVVWSVCLSSVSLMYSL